MSNEEKILEMLVSMQSDIKEIHSDIEGMQSEITGMQSEIKGLQSEVKGLQSEVKEIHGKLDDLIEAHEETRMSVNTILDWTDKVSAAVNFPLPRI